MKSTLSILAIFLLLCTNTAYSDDKFKWSGFISQSLVKTSDGLKLSGNSDGKYGSIARTELGVSASSQINGNIDLRGMTSIIKDGDIDGNPRINYAIVDIHDDTGTTGTRIGRYSYEYGFYNAARNNPHYRDLELPPQGLYRDGFKYMTRSGDGIQIYTRNHISENYSIEVDAGIGKPVLYPQQDLSQTFVLDKNAGSFTNESRVKSINFTVDNRNNGWTLKYGYLLMEYKFSTPIVDNGEAFDMKVRNQYVGLRKYCTFGDFTFEIMRTKMGMTKWDSVMPLEGYVWGGVEGRSFTYKHYVTDKISAIIGYDQWYVNKADKVGEEMEKMTYGYTPSAAMFHRSLNFGMTYRESKYTVKGEIHRVNGNNTIRAENNDITSQTQPTKNNIIILTFAYRFN